MENPKPLLDPHRLGRQIGFVTLCLIIGIGGSLVTRPEIPNWYAHLNKPPFTPPPWLFGPVWTLIYCLMGVTAANTWHTAARTPSPRHLQRFLFAGAFATNALWSILFFGLHQPGLALLDILAYFFFLTQWIRWIARHASAREAWMQALHIGWILFATLLNFSIWWLN